MKRLFSLVVIACATAGAQVELAQPINGLNVQTSRNALRAFVGNPTSGTSYAYDLDGDGAIDATGHTMQATFQTAGDVEVRLLSRDDVGDPWVFVESKTVSIDPSPLLLLRFPGEDGKTPPAYIGVPYTFTIDDDEVLPLVSMAWRVLDADGNELSTGSDGNFAHTFGAVNKYTPIGTEYTVEITLTNAIMSKTFEITITPIPAPREELLQFFTLATKSEEAAFSAIDKMIRATLGFYGVDISQPSPIAPGVPLEVFLRQRLGEVATLRAIQEKHAAIDADVEAGLITQEHADYLKAEVYPLPAVQE